MSPTSLALLAPLFTAQLDGVTIALKDVVAHVEAIRATAQAAGCETVAAQVAGCETAPAERPVKKSLGTTRVQATIPTASYLSPRRRGSRACQSTPCAAGIGTNGCS